MRWPLVPVIVALVGHNLGCGKNEADSNHPAAGGEQAAGRGGAPNTAGAGTGGGASAGHEAGGTAPGAAGQPVSGGNGSAGEPTAEAGAAGVGGAVTQVVCDPKRSAANAWRPRARRARYPASLAPATASA